MGDGSVDGNGFDAARYRPPGAAVGSGLTLFATQWMYLFIMHPSQLIMATVGAKYLGKVGHSQHANVNYISSAIRGQDDADLGLRSHCAKSRKP